MGRPHGLDGSFVVEEASEDRRRFEPGARLWVGGEPALVVARRSSRGRPVVRLDRQVARGSELCVPVEELPPPAEDAYYVFELVGMTVVEEGGGRILGAVRDVLPGVANDALELDTGLLLPMHEACVRSIDREAGRIVVERGFSADG